MANWVFPEEGEYERNWRLARDPFVSDKVRADAAKAVAEVEARRRANRELDEEIESIQIEEAAETEWMRLGYISVLDPQGKAAHIPLAKWPEAERAGWKALRNPKRVLREATAGAEVRASEAASVLAAARGEGPQTEAITPGRLPVYSPHGRYATIDVAKWPDAEKAGWTIAPFHEIWRRYQKKVEKAEEAEIAKARLQHPAAPEIMAFLRGGGETALGGAGATATEEEREALGRRFPVSYGLGRAVGVFFGGQEAGLAPFTGARTLGEAAERAIVRRVPPAVLPAADFIGRAAQRVVPAAVEGAALETYAGVQELSHDPLNAEAVMTLGKRAILGGGLGGTGEVVGEALGTGGRLLADKWGRRGHVAGRSADEELIEYLAKGPEEAPPTVATDIAAKEAGRLGREIEVEKKLIASERATALEAIDVQKQERQARIKNFRSELERLNKENYQANRRARDALGVEWKFDPGQERTAEEILAEATKLAGQRTPVEELLARQRAEARARGGPETLIDERIMAGIENVKKGNIPPAVIPKHLRAFLMSRGRIPEEQIAAMDPASAWQKAADIVESLKRPAGPPTIPGVAPGPRPFADPEKLAIARLLVEFDEIRPIWEKLFHASRETIKRAQKRGQYVYKVDLSDDEIVEIMTRKGMEVTTPMDVPFLVHRKMVDVFTDLNRALPDHGPWRYEFEKAGRDVFYISEVADQIEQLTKIAERVETPKLVQLTQEYEAVAAILSPRDKARAIEEYVKRAEAAGFSATDEEMRAAVRLPDDAPLPPAASIAHKAMRAEVYRAAAVKQLDALRHRGLLGQAWEVIIGKTVPRAIGGAIGLYLGGKIIGGSLGHMLGGYAGYEIGARLARNIRGRLFMKRVTADRKIARDIDTFVGNKPPRSVAPASLALARPIFSDREPTASPGEAAKRRAVDISSLAADPVKTSFGLFDTLQPIRDVSVGLYDQVDGLARRMIDYLNSKAPKAPPPSPFRKTSAWVPNDAQIESFARAVAVAEEGPVRVIEELAAGRLSAESVEALRVMYPASYESIKAQIMARLMELRADLPYEKRLQLGVFFGMPVEEAQEPARFAQLQATFDAVAEEQSAAGGMSKQDIGSVKLKEEPTPGQRFAG